MTLLGLLIVVGNFKYLMFMKRKKQKLAPFDLLKTYLTITDISTGMFILISLVIYFCYTKAVNDI